MILFDMQRLIMARAIGVFGFRAARDKNRAALRFLEEALELVQATHAVDEVTVIRLVKRVFQDRPGPLQREVGHCFNNLLALCESHGVNAGEAQIEGFMHFLDAPIERLHLSEAAKTVDGF